MDLHPARNVAVITPWYPTSELPFAGAFVQAAVEATAPHCSELTVYHCDSWGSLPDEQEYAAAREAHRRLLPSVARPVPGVAGSRLVHVPVLPPQKSSWPEFVRAYSDWLGLALGGRPIDADVVHGHVGLRGGWLALQHARPGARVFVTEHATFLPAVLADPEGRELYDEVLHRCTGFFAVGEPVRRPLVEAFPHHAEKIGTIPNPIAFDAPRAVPVTALRRWLYVGSFIERKGVMWLLEAFAACHREDPELRLTMVGGGKLTNRLRTRAAELGVAHAVSIRWAVPPDEALRLMREHDLLVHPSRLETFGMTIVEAVAAGTPVLVTRSGGPQESLAGIEDQVGVLIDVEENAESIVEGYHRLRDRFPHGLDLPRARLHLEERYGYETVGRVHHEHWFGSPPLPAQAAVRTPERQV